MPTRALKVEMEDRRDDTHPFKVSWTAPKRKAWCIRVLEGTRTEVRGSLEKPETGFANTFRSARVEISATNPRREARAFAQLPLV